MSIELLGWLVLLFPLAGTLVIALGWRALGGRSAGWIGTGAIAASFVCAVLTLLELESHGHEERQIVAVAWDYATSLGVDAQMSILIDPLSVLMILIVS